MLLFNSAGNINLNGSLGLGVMPLSIQGVIKYQTMISIAYLGFGCVRTTLSSIWILYSPLYKSPLSWTIFNSDNVHVLGMYNDGFSSYSCWLSSKFFRIIFLSKKGSLLKIYQMHNPLQQIAFLLQKIYERNNSTSLLQDIAAILFCIDTSYCYQK